MINDKESWKFVNKWIVRLRETDEGQAIEIKMKRVHREEVLD